MRNFILILVFILSTSSWAKEKTYVVIMDDNFPLYKRVMMGFGIESKVAGFYEYSLEGKVVNSQKIFVQAKSRSPSVIIAMGPKSAHAAKKQAGDIPVIYCMVPRIENYDLTAANLVGIRLGASYDDQLQTLKSIFKQAHRVGVLYNPTLSQAVVDRLKKKFSKLDLRWVGIEIHQPSDTSEKLETVKAKIDILWMMSDPTALNLSAWDASHQFAIQNKIPFFALDDGFVARGALIGYSVDYVGLGRQVAKLANQIAFDNLSIKEINVIEAEGLSLSVNMKTMSKIGLKPEFAVDLLNYAAVRQYSIQPF